MTLALKSAKNGDLFISNTGCSFSFIGEDKSATRFYIEGKYKESRRLYLMVYWYNETHSYEMDHPDDLITVKPNGEMIHNCKGFQFGNRIIGTLRHEE